MTFTDYQKALATIETAAALEALKTKEYGRLSYDSWTTYIRMYGQENPLKAKRNVFDEKENTTREGHLTKIVDSLSRKYFWEDQLLRSWIKDKRRIVEPLRLTFFAAFCGCSTLSLKKKK